MNKKVIRLTESDLHRIVKESVEKIVNEMSSKGWSNEDEEMLFKALDMVEWYAGKYESQCRVVSDWLKSLKYRINHLSTELIKQPQDQL